ncbi:MAG TPA: hypothetical protein VFS97_05695 [Nitrososphaeraceae archaeon]|nr:hypothetical protein [Nitrososphaeraceae archaeon]
MSFGLGEILTTRGLNSLTFDDPYAKLCFTTMVVQALTHPSKRHRAKIHRRTLYIDTDTVFTAYLMAGLIVKDCFVPLPTTKNAQRVFISHCTDTRGDALHTHDDGSNIIDKNVIEANTNHEIDKRFVQLFLPSEGRFEYLLGDVIASMPEASIVIFDSLTSFYNMYPVSYIQSKPTKQFLRKRQQQSQKRKQETELSEKGELRSLRYSIGRLNHLLSIFIMLLVKHGVYYNIPVLVTSMVRYKKISGDVWIKSYACRRLLNQKSIVRLSVEMLNENDLAVNIMQHPSIVPQTLVFRNVGLYSAFKVDQRKS